MGQSILRLPESYDAKKAFQNLQKAFLPNVPWTVGQKGALSYFEKMVY